MKLIKATLAVALAVTTLGMAGAAQAQDRWDRDHYGDRYDRDHHDGDRWDRDRHDRDRWDRRHYGWNRGHHYGWRSHRVTRRCWTVWRHHHRERICRVVRR